jgi:hypothetical protein
VFVLAESDAAGTFSAVFPDLREGDYFEVRARHSDGTSGDWISMRARDLEPSDARLAQGNLDALKLTVVADGVEVSTDQGRLSEPHAHVELVNSRTGRRTVVQLDATGALPSRLVLEGRAGDWFRIAVDDGTTNQGFGVRVGSVRVPGAGLATY